MFLCGPYAFQVHNKYFAWDLIELVLRKQHPSGVRVLEIEIFPKLIYDKRKHKHLVCILSILICDYFFFVNTEYMAVADPRGRLMR